MESYRILYRIKAVHDYFDGKPCTALQCRLTPQGAELARRRGLLFRQTAADEWTLLCQAKPDTANDVLTLSLSITDPAFTLYTAWNGLRPSADYALDLPQQEEYVDAATAIHLSGKRRSIGFGFCTVSLRLTEQMAQASEAGQPMQTTLRFHAPEIISRFRSATWATFHAARCRGWSWSMTRLNIVPETAPSSPSRRCPA